MSSENTDSLLIEFLTEELPPLNLEKNIGLAFSQSLTTGLKDFISENSVVSFFVTPRRFGCIITKITNKTAQKTSIRKGPALKDAFTATCEPSKALLGFIKAAGVKDHNELIKEDGYFYAHKLIVGCNLMEFLPQAIINALKNLPIAKHMRWGNNEYSFIRPLHNLLIFYGDKVICNEDVILGLSPSDTTYGHRIMAENPIKIAHADSYLEQLYTQGRVIVDFAKRKAIITTELTAKALALGLNIAHMDGLIDEVTALVEYPVILQGEFAEAFLAIPQECLILSMAKHQKYFALVDKNGKLSNKFLLVANIDSPNAQIIINGNQKVLSSRLSDAKFFYETDLKHPLSYHLTKLNQVIYHHKLGSQYQRVQRLKQIAGSIAPLLHVDVQLAQLSAGLLKADLTTTMVSEFPELQGIMGKYYALYAKESPELANAIEKHYYPRFSGDTLPDTPLAITMALADKLELLVGIWGIGLIPSGDKDQFGLRRAALGIVRILLIYKLSITELLKLAHKSFSTLNLSPNTVDALYSFIFQRLEYYLIDLYAPNLVRSVLANKVERFSHLLSLLDSLKCYLDQEKTGILLAANKRIKNILEKNVKDYSNIPKCEASLLVMPQEKALFDLYNSIADTIQTHIHEQNWNGLFTCLTKFNQPLADFFDKVMVMDTDISLRDNRISLLYTLYQTFNQVCDLAELN